MWTDSRPTMVLLYCAVEILGEPTKRRFQKNNVFKQLHVQGSLHAMLRATLSRYENLMRGLEACPEVVEHVARWRVVQVASPDMVPMAQFTNAETSRLETLGLKALTE